MNREDWAIKEIVLLLSSVIFYCVWSFKYFSLLFITILINFKLGSLIYKSNSKSRKAFFTFGIIVNLGNLIWFKYTNFIIGNINFFFDTNIEFLKIILPLAISFYTFQQIAFLADCLKRDLSPPTFKEYFFFVIFFPQLIAGPIVHHKEIIPFIKKIKIDSKTLSFGLTWFSFGLFKKVIIADTMGDFADPLFLTIQKGNPVGFFECWIGMLSYTLQIYFDFSGYSDMAIGLGKIFNINIPINFKSPYKSRNIIEFWRRWHITLSRFLRDYLYIAMGGNRKGKIRRYQNLMLTMLLGGLWHGASWNFVIWGFLHGMYLVLNHGFNSISVSKSLNPNLVKISGTTLTFLMVVFAWIFFRSPDLNSSFIVLKGLLGGSGFAITHKYEWLIELIPFFDFPMNAEAYILKGKTQLFKIIFALLICFVFPNTQEIMNSKWTDSKILSAFNYQPNYYFVIITTLLLIFSILNLSSVNEFIYFQF